MGSEIVVALIGFAGVAVTAASGYLATHRQRIRAELAATELSFRQAALDFTDVLGEWHDTQRELESLMTQTAVDRFLILKAWNGQHSPKWATAIYQQRRGEHQPVSYVHFELDADYVSRLQHIKAGRPLVFRVDDIPESAIKAVYENEQVTASAWFHLESLKLPGSSARAVTYCSFATHDPEGLTDAEITRCQIIVGRLKGIAGLFHHHDREE